MVNIITSSAEIMASVAGWTKPKGIQLVHGVFPGSTQYQGVREKTAWFRNHNKEKRDISTC
jgi:hypothetical protein